MDYDGLKRMLKERTAEENFFAEKDEAAFVNALEEEMRKVFDFRDVKVGELTRHVQHCENAINGENNEEQMNSEIDRITQEVSNLAAFSRINHTAFVKILKKHDKHTEFMLRAMFMIRLNPRAQQTEALDGLIYRLSRLFDRLRRGQEEVEDRQMMTAKDAQSFVRKTTKYWVHPDNVMEVKCAILRNLPVLVFPNAERRVDPAISSVYFDNARLDLYRGRIQKEENAEAIRFRWYGSEEPSNIFVERKTHKEDWTGETSVKERFLIKEKHIDDYMTGKFTADDIAEKVRKHEAVDNSNCDATRQLAQEIQDKILVQALIPTLRTFYNRTAFQLPGDARIRISLDTELYMIREDIEWNGHWKRRDIGVVHPFNEVPLDQIVKFPYAILEVKLQVEGNEQVPDWINTLIEGPLV